MADYGKGDPVEHENYCMNSPYARNVDTMNAGSKYPAWNKKADEQAKYPDAGMQGAKSNTQPMGKPS